MKGYLLNFYKFSPSLESEVDKGTPEGFNRCIVWSIFDRLEVREIHNFSEYRKSEVSEKNWLGERQFAMLYELNSNSKKLIFSSECDECKFVFNVENFENNEKMRFFGVTFINFTQEFHDFFYDDEQKVNSDNISEYIYGVMTEAIDKLIVDNKIPQNEIAYDIYGILGGQDLAIIWLTNQFEYIAKILEALRISESSNNKKGIANISSIIGINNINENAIEYDDVSGKLVVKLTKKESYDNELFKKDIAEILGLKPEEKIPPRCTIFGEHDILLEIPANRFIPQLYKRDGIFHNKSRKFINNFIQSKTEIIIPNDYSDVVGYEFPFELSANLKRECKFPISESKKFFEIIEEIVSSDCLKDALYLQETIWLLYEDFLKNITSSFTYPWSNDLYYQFEESMNYLKTLVNSDVRRVDQYKHIQSVISSMRQMMLHVAQANRLFFEVPNTHLKHTGSYSMILHMYYGVVKKYIELAYVISKYDEQSSIVPFISFDVTPIAKSEYCGALFSYEKNIVRIELPYDALVNIPKYIKLLAHEIYHYIAPRNRKERNLLVGAISFSLVIGELSADYMYRELSVRWSDVTRDLWVMEFQNIVRTYALNFFAEKPNIIAEYVEDYDDKATWTKYFEKFDKFFENKFFESENMLKNTYEWINNAIKKINEESRFEEVPLLHIDEFQRKIRENKEKLIQYPLDRDIRYALRETTADYFMLQATGMPIEEYLEHILHYQEIMESDDDNIAQKARCAFAMDLYLGGCFADETKNIEEEEEKNDSLCELLENQYRIEKDKAKKLVEYYVQIKNAFRVYQSAFNMYFEMFCFEDIKEQCPKFEEELKEMKKLLESSTKDSFVNNVRFVERFQKQKTLKELEEIKLQYGRITAKRPRVDLEQIKVNVATIPSIKEDEIQAKATDLAELLEMIGRGISAITDVEGEQIWFRGHENSKYLLIPSLYRMKDQKQYFYSKSKTRREIQESLLDLFKVKAYNAPEIIDKMLNDDVRVLAAMQHYSVPTNLLDWTTSVFSAIYFALAKEINKEKELVKGDAVVYILNPVRMNVIRNLLYKNVLNIKGCKQVQYPIPSISCSKVLFDGYFPSTKEESENSRFPIAGYVPFDNNRIRTQMGTFTVFGLDNKEDCYGEEIKEDTVNKQVDFSKCSLMDMQRKYKEYCNSNSDLKYKEFITEVIIEEDAKQKIADCLRSLGIAKANFFPELDNLSKELTQQVSQYLDLIN